MSSSYYEKYRSYGPPIHGGSVHGAGILDFSISVNPFPLPKSVKKAYLESLSGIGVYPDTGNKSLTAAVSESYGIESDTLLMTNGSAEAFSLIASVLLGQGKTAMVLSPCYSDYEHVSRLTGAEVRVHMLQEAQGFEPDSNLLLDDIACFKPDVIWLCSPNNPTGVLLKDSFCSNIVNAAANYGGFVVLDEAYAAFAIAKKTSAAGLNRSANLIVVRSMTKDFGIPGLRLGYINAEPELIRVLDLHKPCWSVSFPAQAVGIALMNEMDYFQGSWNETLLLQSAMIDRLRLCGIDPVAASSNECGIFIFFKAPGISCGESFDSIMEHKGIRIRNCESMGAEGFYRIGVKQQEDNSRFISVFTEVMNG